MPMPSFVPTVLELAGVVIVAAAMTVLFGIGWAALLIGAGTLAYGIRLDMEYTE